MGTRMRRCSPPRFDQTLISGRNAVNPFADNCCETDCSKWLCVHTAYHSGLCDPAPDTAKASPPSVLRFHFLNRLTATAVVWIALFVCLGSVNFHCGASAER